MARLVGVLAAAVLAGVLATPAAPAAAATATTVAPATPMAGEQVTVSATLPSRVVRPVRLQKHLRGAWRTAQTRSTSSTGRVSFATSTTTRVPVRLQAPRTTVRGRSYAAVTTTTRTVSVAPQSAAATWRRGDGDTVQVDVTSTPARGGRGVRLERRVDGAWRELAGSAGTLDVAGRARLVAGDLADARGADVRAVVAPWRGAASATAAAAEPTGAVVVVAPDVAGRRPGEDVTLQATPTGAVDRVRFLVDGRVVGDDASAPFTTTWTTREGTHDVVARAYAGRRSSLSPVVPVRVSRQSVSADTGLPDGFGLEVVQSGFDLPTSAAAVPGGPVLVTEKSGRVKAVRLEGEDGWSAPRTVLDVSDVVLDEGDAGMVGIAVDPDFERSGHVYVSYALEPEEPGYLAPTSQQVVRYTWDEDADALDPASRHVVLGSVTGPACHEAVTTDDCLPLIGMTHTVGELAFTDAGHLLVGVGDGSLYASTLQGRTAALRAQDPRVLAGKVLRVDPATGRGVPGNPLFDGDGSDNASRVLALGLRNPFRFTVDGDRLVVGDVGEQATEELDVVPLEADRVPNLGWPCREGDDDTDVPAVADADSPWHVCAGVRAATGADALVAPVHTYPHAGGGSVTAGAFLASDAYPEGWRGRYLFGDFAQDFLRAGHLHDGDLEDVRTLADSTAAGGPVKMLTGPDGLVWYLSISTGSLRRITYTPAGTQADRCAVGTFRRSFHDLDGDDSVFDRSYPDGPYRWLLPYADARLPAQSLADPTCEARVHLDPTSGSPWTRTDDRAHPGDRWGAAWRGRVELEGGRYRFSVDGSEWMRLAVDGEQLHDFYSNAFWGQDRVHEVTLEPGQHVVTAELVHGDRPEAYAGVTWERVGAPPTVRLTAPGNGTTTAPDGTVAWAVDVSDPDADLVVTADLLHYSGGVPHAHPQRRSEGRTSGSFTLDDEHAPGQSAWRLRATATDADGARSTSAPVYVCLTGNRVGPCED